MKKIIIFLLLILSICIFSQEKKEYDPYLIRDGEKLLSYNDDTEDDEEYDMDEYDSEEENPYYWETYIEDDTEKNMADFRK